VAKGRYINVLNNNNNNSKSGDIVTVSRKSGDVSSYGVSAGIDGGSDVDADLLTGIYERVAESEFTPGTDHVSQVIRIEQMIVGKKPVRYVTSRYVMLRHVM